MTDKEEPQWKRNLSIAVTVVGAVMGIVLLVLSIIAYSQLAGFISDYTSVINSWKAQPVTQFVVSGSSCGEKVQGNWPGIYPACDCSHKNAGSNSTSSDTEACTSQQISDNCDTLSSTPGIDLNIWGGASGSSLCLTRSDPSALARSTYADGTCGATEQVCSNETIPFCWPSSSLCPVTDFEFDTVDRTNTTGYNADQMLVAGSGFLYVKRGNILNGTAFPNRAVSPFFQPIGLPITDVTFQPGNVCFLGGCGYSNNDASSANAQYKSNHPGEGYTMRSLDCQGGCKEPDGSSLSPDGYDLRYVKSSYSQTQTQLFTAGNVPVEYQNVGGSNPWYLQYRSEIKWATDCPETRQRVVDRDTDVKNVRNAQVALLVFGILSFIFLTIYFPCIELCGSDDIKDKARTPNLICKICIKLATLVCTIVTVVIAYSTLSFWSSVNDAGGCADALTNETFKTLGDKFGDLSYKNAISTAASSTTSILDGVLFACKRFA